MDTVLEFKVPEIKGNLKRTHACLLAELLGPAGKRWIMQNHILLKSSYTRLLNSGEMHLDFMSPGIISTLPFIDVVRMNKFDFKKTLPEVIREGLAHGLYPYLFFEEKYIPNTFAHDRGYNLKHRALIHGYQDGKYLYGNYDNQRVFREFSITEETVEEAALAIDDTDFYLIKLNRDFEFELDKTLVCEMLDDYIKGNDCFNKIDYYFTNSNRKYDDPLEINKKKMSAEKYIYGINSYENILVGLRVLNNNSQGKIHINDINFAVFRNHKKCLLELVRELSLSNKDKWESILDECVRIEAIATKMFNVLIKNNYFKIDLNITDKMLEAVSEIQSSEYDVIRRVLQCLS